MEDAVIKVFLAQESKGKIGGGWTFVENLSASTPRLVLVDNPDFSDVILIPSATMCTGEYMRSLPKYNKPIVLRVDNLPPDHRNSGNGWSRFMAGVSVSDHIIFQSEWAKNHIYPQIQDQFKKDFTHSVVFNGVDTKLFNPIGNDLLDLKINVGGNDAYIRDYSPRFLFLLSSSDPAKRIEEVVHLYREYHSYAVKQGLKPLLLLLGKGYPLEWVDYAFEFRNNESFFYNGQVIANREWLAKLYRSVDGLIFPAYGNACSNTVLEAMASGINVLFQPYGGQRELLEPFGIPLNYMDMSAVELMESLTYNTFKSAIRQKVERQLSLQVMGESYARVFEKLLRKI